MSLFRSLVLASLGFASVAGLAQAPASLKDAYRGSFVVGAALNADQFTGKDSRSAAIVKEQFSSITPENDLKWERIHPKPDTYAFDPADRYVAFGEKNHMFIVGHCLIWHAQTPAWVFQDENGKQIGRDALLKRMHDHISTVVGRYKGRIQSWDVVNEALNEDGTLRQSPWMKIIGEDYIAKAFQYAHEADPQAQLNYNDYSIENEAKRNGAVALIRKLQAQGIPVSTVGIQGHDSLDWPSADLEDATITAFAVLGVKVAITELDVDVLPSAWSPTADVTLNVKSDPKINPYPNGLPDDVQKALAKQYAGLFAVYLKHRDVVNRVTFWGVTDGDSWKNNWPVKGRTDYPLLFDRAGKPKPAYDAVIKEAAQSLKK